MGQLFTDLQAVRLDVEANAVIILDQTSLPGEKVYLSLSTKEAVWDAIHRLKVRGAPAIGITAAYGIYVCCKSLRARKFDDFYKGFVEIRDYFESSRPTAVNLSAALERMERCVLRNRELPVSGLNGKCCAKLWRFGTKMPPRVTGSACTLYRCCVPEWGY